MSRLRVRFAPSPTGYLHIGGARTALFNYLLARREKGVFVLRIEDTDVARSTQESVDAILQAMDWLGMHCDEGPVYQSDRFDLYRAKIDQLLTEGKAYRCYCSADDLERKREDALKEGRKPKYDGTCREGQQGTAEDRPFVVRFKAPQEGETTFVDRIKGSITFQNDELDDLIIQRTDGTPTYNFVVVVDDAEMGINLVLRGDDHINNTPRQIMLYEALGYPVPDFAHVPMILGADKSRLSKRHGATSVMAYKEMGYLPEALVNYLVRLGWSHGDQEIFSMDELIKQFSLDRVAKNPAVFDFEKLKWVNGIYIRNLPKDKVAEGIRPFLGEYLAEKSPEEQEVWLNYVAEALFDHINTFADIKTELEKFMKEDIQISDEAKEVLALEESIAVIRCFRDKLAALEEVNPPAVKELIKETGKEMNAKGKGLFMPVRVGISGELHGPDLANTVTILGKEKTLSRIDKILQG